MEPRGGFEPSTASSYLIFLLNNWIGAFLSCCPAAALSLGGQIQETKTANNMDPRNHIANTFIKTITLAPFFVNQKTQERK